MPQRQQHRGRHPEDAKLFTEKWIPVLRKAVADLSFLLSRGYAENAAQKLVGDHYQLSVRQRRAVLGASCADASLEFRNAHAVTAEDLAGQPLGIDGYNLLIAVECALSRGILLKGRDGAIRDLASVHGSYHKVEETLPAIRIIGQTLHELFPSQVTWYFDAPVSNSGRLKTLLCEQAEESGWDWRVELDRNPDKTLAASGAVVATSDGWILDRAQRSVDLKDPILAAIVPAPEIIYLSP